MICRLYSRIGSMRERPRPPPVGEGSTTTTREGGRIRDARVIVVATPDGLLTFPLPERGSLVVGRASECDVRVVHESVSRRHVQLTIGENVTVEDLGSRNGTAVGGSLLRAKESVE